MILSAHQPNFIPWLSFFDKLNKADIFILMIHCQYEKNGWQNRCQVRGKYWTKPIEKGNKLIKDKVYMDGQGMTATNVAWIVAICRTLGIDTKKIQMDHPTPLTGTDRIIDYCHKHKCSQYLTNPDASRKYLDLELMAKHKIDVLSYEFSQKVHVFEAFETWGIEGTIKLLKKEKARWKASLNSSVT